MYAETHLSIDLGLVLAHRLGRCRRKDDGIELAGVVPIQSNEVVKSSEGTLIRVSRRSDPNGQLTILKTLPWRRDASTRLEGTFELDRPWSYYVLNALH